MININSFLQEPRALPGSAWAGGGRETREPTSLYMNILYKTSFIMTFYKIYFSTINPLYVV